MFQILCLRCFKLVFKENLVKIIQLVYKLQVFFSIQWGLICYYILCNLSYWKYGNNVKVNSDTFHVSVMEMFFKIDFLNIFFSLQIIFNFFVILSSLIENCNKRNDEALKIFLHNLEYIKTPPWGPCSLSNFQHFTKVLIILTPYKTVVSQIKHPKSLLNIAFIVPITVSNKDDTK